MGFLKDYWLTITLQILLWVSYIKLEDNFFLALIIIHLVSLCIFHDFNKLEERIKKMERKKKK